MASRPNAVSDFPCSLIIKTPFPTHRLATTALEALKVDEELSPLVYRTFSLITPPTSPISTTSSNSSSSSSNSTTYSPPPLLNPITTPTSGHTVLLTEYRAKTNRMLRVAVNGFMESLGIVLGVMEKLDVDVLADARTSNSGKTGDVAAAAAARSTAPMGTAPMPTAAAATATTVKNTTAASL